MELGSGGEEGGLRPEPVTANAPSFVWLSCANECLWLENEKNTGPDGYGTDEEKRLSFPLCTGPWPAESLLVSRPPGG